MYNLCIYQLNFLEYEKFALKEEIHLESNVNAVYFVDVYVYMET